MSRDDVRAVAALVVAWVVAVVLVDPRADVSLLDDWCYAISVEQILNGQGFHVSPWSSTLPLVHIWWGTLFAWLGGFSFTTLRVSTLVFWLLGTLSAYGGLRALGASVVAASIGAATVALYPNMFVLAFSYMTDVPFMALTLASVWGLVAGLRQGHERTTVVGLCFAVLAFLVRPVAIALPAGLFLGAFALPNPHLRRRAIVCSLATIVVMAVASSAATRLFPWGGDGGVQYRVMRLSFIFLVPPMVYVEAGLSMLAHVGLAIVPVLVALGPAPRRATWIGAAVLLAVAFVTSHFAESAVSALKFAHTTSIEELGAARPLLQGAPGRTVAGAACAIAATVIGLVAGAVLCGRIADGLRRGGWLRTPAWACVAGFGLGSAGLCFVLWFFYDRYYLPLVVVGVAFALADAAAPVASWRRPVAAGLLALMAFVDVTGTRDMLAYARAVEATAAELRAAGVPEIDLDAGYVENGWRLYAHPERLPPGKDPTLDVPHVTSKADGLPWVIANTPLAGYRVDRTVEFPTWWAYTDRIYVLRRN